MGNRRAGHLVCNQVLYYLQQSAIEQCFPGVKKRRRRVKRAKINRVELGSMGVRNFSTVADGFQIQVQIAAHSLRKKTSVLPRFSSELFGYLVCGPCGMEFANLLI